MRSRLLAAFTVLTLTVGAAAPVAARDDEFERLRAEVKKKEAERAARPKPPVAAAPKPAGPSLARFMPPAPKGWRMRGSPFDDGAGMIDLSQQASADYVLANGDREKALDVTIMKHSALIGAGVPKLGFDKMTGRTVSKVSVAGRPGYLSWDAGSDSGKLALTAGRYEVLVAGRHVAPEVLTALAASIDLAKLSGL